MPHLCAVSFQGKVQMIAMDRIEQEPRPGNRCAGENHRVRDPLSGFLSVKGRVPQER